MEQLQRYIDKEYYLFPINAKTKKPAIKDNLASASIDPDQLAEWSEKFPECNWGISLAKSGLVAVDVDVKYSGLEVWESMLHKHGGISTLMAESQGGGLHYVFAAEKGARYRGKIQKGIDIKHNGYIAVWPSQIDGRFYDWINWGMEPSEVPAWLNDYIKRSDKKGQRGPVTGLGENYLHRCVEKLKEVELTYDEWTSIGMAIHSAQPNEQGLDLFLDLTSGVSFVEGDLEKAVNKWEGFRRFGGVTARTLTWICKEKGIEPPNPTTKEDFALFKAAERKDLDNKQRRSKGFEKTENGRFVSWSEERIVEYFNERGFAYCKDDLRNPFIITGKGRKGKNSVQRMTLAALRDLTAPYFWATKKFLNNEVKIVHTPAYKSWVESSNRRTFDRIVFEPNLGPDDSVFNLWSGIPIESEDGEPTAILDMIFRSLCNGDERKFNWFLDWLAHIIQYPDIKGTTVPVFVGRQGTGKGIMADIIMGDILGDLYITVKTSQELMGRFNAHLAGKLLTHIDEATWRGNKTEDGILKSIIGSPTLSVEEKFGGRYSINNYSRYIISSNNKEAVALEVGNRRYCVFETSDELADNTKYFNEVVRAIKAGGEAKKFYNLLLNRRINHFDPFKILEGNTAGQESKLATEGIMAEFWYNLLFEQPRQIMWKSHLDMQAVYDHFVNFDKNVKSWERAITPHRFWFKAKKLIPVIENKEKTRVRVEGKRIYAIENINIFELQTSFAKNMVIEYPENMPEYTEYLIESNENNDLFA